MRIKNARLFPAAPMFGRTHEGEWFLSIILKATFRLENRLEPARVAKKQLPIFTTDDPYDPKKPEGTLRFESDMVPFKPRTDVLLVGSAHAPMGRPQKYVDVTLVVGPVGKQIRVFGERRWSFKDPRDPMPLVAGPVEFTEMPLTWDRAFGGIDEKAGTRPDVPAYRPWYAANYLGKGFSGARTIESIDERELPNLEDPRDPIRAWDTRPRPAGCGYFPRNSEPRVRYAGTYDEKWKTERAPLMPLDFCFDYYNAADPELQVQGYLQGNERGLIENVTPGGGRVEFLLPCIRPRFTVRRSTDPASPHFGEAAAALDTLVLVPDDKAFTMTWRAIIRSCIRDHNDVEEVGIEYENLPWAEAGQ